MVEGRRGEQRVEGWTWKGQRGNEKQTKERTRERQRKGETERWREKKRLTRQMF